MQINFSERELEDFLCTDDNLQKYLNLKFIARQVNIAPAGIIDILAYSRDSDCFVIIELKKDLLDSSALLQGSSYLRYYQDLRSFNLIYRKRKRKFCLLLVGQNLETSLTKLVKYAERDEFFSDQEPYYKLFNLDLEKGINFDYFSTLQTEYQNKLDAAVESLEHEAYYFLRE